MKPEITRFDEGSLSAQLQQLLAASNIEARRFIVGFSGGLDSTCLLLGMNRLREKLGAPLCAIHFDHGLHADSPRWANHCAAACEQADIPFECVRGDIASDTGAGIEAAARSFRYDHLARNLGVDDVFLTAHHASDQAETLLLHLLRGSGPQGLAAIPAVRRLGRGWVVRPLLNFDRASMEVWLSGQGSDWIVDPANEDESFDRNFIRHQVIPLLRQRWPASVDALHRSAALVRADAASLALLIESALSANRADECTMPLQALLDRPLFLQASLLRHWARGISAEPLPFHKLQEFLAQINETGGRSRPGQMAELRWASGLIKRHRDRLWLHSLDAMAACPERPWNESAELDLGKRIGKLVLKGASAPGAQLEPGSWRAGPRREGQRIRLHDGGPNRRVKHLMNEYGIPPWLRDAVPVLYVGDCIAAIGDWHQSQKLTDWLSRHSATLTWAPGDPVLRRIRAECQPPH